MEKHVDLKEITCREEQHFDDLLSLSAKDVLNYFKCIPQKDYQSYGIDEEDIPLGTFAALKHPSLFPTPLGGNAYGIGLFEQRILNDEELKLLESLNLNDASVVEKHFSTINEIYRKMGLLIRLSRKGIFYYLIPSSFLAHLIVDVRSRLNIITSLLPEIKESKGLKIGILTSSDDIIVHEFIGRFPQHRFIALSELYEISTGEKPFDAIICPHSIEDYLRIVLARSSPKILTSSRTVLMQLSGHVLYLIRKSLHQEGWFIIISPSSGFKTSSLQKLTFLNRTYIKLFIAFAGLYKSSLSPNVNLCVNEEILVNTKDIQLFLRMAPSIKTEIQKIFNKPLDQIDEKELLSLAPRWKMRFSNPVTLAVQRKLIPRFFELNRWEEIFPEEYKSLWEKHISIRKFPPLFSCIRAKPRKPKVSREKIEAFLERSPIAGCPVSLVADYKNTLNYVTQVLDFLEEDLSKEDPTTKSHPLFRTLISCRKKLDEVQNLLGPPGIVKEPVKFFDHIPELSLLGFSRSQLKEMGLIVTGHSSLGRVIMGKYPLATLRPLSDLIKNQPRYAYYLVRMTIAELKASLGSSVTERDIGRVKEVIEDIESSNLTEQFTNESLDYLLAKTYERIMAMSRTREEDLQYELPKPMEKYFIETFCIDKDFLTEFLRARFHGTGHILPSLGFTPSLVLLWTCLTFWKNSYNQSKTRKISDPVINLNRILKGIPQEHRAKQIEKLKQALMSAINRDTSDTPLCEAVCFLCPETKSWFCPEVKLHFYINVDSNTVEVGYLDLDESIKIVDNFSRHLESKSFKTIPPILIQEADHHIEKILRYVKGVSHGTASKQLSMVPSIDSVLVNVWKSFVEKLFSPEDAYETLTLIGKQSPTLLSIALPNSTEESIYILSKAFRRLRSITEKRRSAFQDPKEENLSSTPGERISISSHQFREIEKMLCSVHADFSMYQAMIISLLIGHLSSDDVSQHASPFLDNMVKSDMILPSQLPVIYKHILNLLKAKQTIVSVIHAKAPLISLGNVISLNSAKTFVDASFLLVAVVEDIPKGFLETEILNYLLSLKQDILEAITQGISWQRYMLNKAVYVGSSFNPSNAEKIKTSIMKDMENYRLFIEETNLEPLKIPALSKGRYIMAFNRLLRFTGLLSVQLKDIISFLEGAPLITLYRDKSYTSLGFNTFKALIEKARKIFDTIFSYPEEQRLKLLSDFDELNFYTKIDEKNYSKIIKT
ncbi:MAG: hypothetical protein N2260_01955 [Syntrophobacterales bacterium]|nr:hypothetical protein [Syntrophobacterales bacterium]